MSSIPEQSVLDALLDSWDRNNTILLNLLCMVPAGGLEARAAADSPSVADMFTHIHYVRMVFVSEDAPEFASEIRYQQWMNERDPLRIEQMLSESAKLVGDAVRGRVEAARGMDLHYDHPILLLQHMIWHEGYHHGQIKLALKLTGHPIPDSEAGPVTWSVWMRKTKPNFSGEWVLNRRLSILSDRASAMESGVLEIDHHDPKCGFRMNMSAGGESIKHAWESLSDGIEVAGGGVVSSLRWDGDALVFDARSQSSDDSWAMSWRYELQEEGRRLRAVEKLRGGGRDQDNVWIFERS